MDKKIIDLIESKNAEYMSFLEDVVSIESPTEYKKGVDEVGAYFIKKAQEKKWDIEINKQEVSGDVVCITMNSSSNKQPIVLSAHIDTVFPVGSFKPLIRYEGDRLYGPGTRDCKGGVVAGFYAMDILEQLGYTDRPIMLILQSDEETNSVGSNKATINYMIEKSKNAVAFLNLEGHRPGFVVTARKGITTYLFKVYGKAAHACECEKGASAILEASHKIIELEKIKGEGAITSSCGLIKGGTAKNTVPDYCEFTAEFRYITDEEKAKIEKIVEKVSNTCFVDGCSCKVEIIGNRCSMPLEKRNLDLLDKINVALKNNGMEVLDHYLDFGGSDAADITRAGIPCLDELGLTGGPVHVLDEYIYTNSLYECVKKLVAIIPNL